jgi:translation elongation factor EF-1alpha
MKFKLFKKSKDIPKVLVLGSSNSGKSTIVQQMMMIDGYLFKIGEREELKIKLVKQAVDSLKVVKARINSYLNDTLTLRY